MSSSTRTRARLTVSRVRLQYTASARSRPQTSATTTPAGAGAGGAPFVERMVIENDRVTYEGVPFAAGDVDLEISCTNGTDTWAPYQVVLKPQGVGGRDRRR